MTSPWRKAIRDFAEERTRSVLVVLAIALGIAAFSAVLSGYSILTRALNDGYLATNPAAATLWTDAVDDDLLAALRSEPGIRDVEARRALHGRIQAGPAEWRNLVLFVVRDYGNIRISKLDREQGAWPPAAGEILIERDALEVARARIGDEVSVRTTNGEERKLRLAGTVHDVGQAQARMENLVYGYITLDTLEQLGEEPFLDQLKIEVSGDKLDEEHVRAVAARAERRVEAAGHAVRRMEVPKPGEHPHAAIMGLLLLAMSGFGLLALLLAGILVVNLLSGLMASQIRQVGVMKAIGGSHGQIARIYFAQALLLGIAALVVAIPLGIAGSHALCRYLAVFLNFDIASFAVAPWVYLLVAAIGLAVPVAAAAFPIWKGCGVSVREALAAAGVSGNAFGATPFDRALARLGGVGRPLLFAVRNAFRRRTRMALTLSTLAASGLFFMCALSVRASMIGTLDRLFAARKYDLTVSLATMVPMGSVDRAIRGTPGVRLTEGWITAEGAIPSGGESAAAKDGASGAGASHAGGSAGAPHGGASPDGDRFSVVALPETTTLLRPEIVEGRALEAGDTNALVMNGALAALGSQMQVGREVTLGMGPVVMSWRIVGRAREPFSPAIAYIPRSYLDQVGGHAGMTNSLRLVLERNDPASIASVKAALDRNLEREGIRALASTSKADSRFAFDQHMEMIYVFLIVVACILAGVGGLGLSTTMSLNVLERRREMGILRAIGASPAVVGQIVVAEAGVIGILSWTLAGLLAWPASAALGKGLAALMFKSRLDVVFDTTGLFVWLAVSLALAVVASFLPAWHASRRPIREAIGYE